MTPQLGKLLVYANAAFLAAASLGGFVTDVRARLRNGFGSGAAQSGAGRRHRHDGSAWRIHLLLGTCNLTFWQVFIISDALAMGYVTTIAHWLFAAGHLVVLTTPGATADASRAFR